MTITAWKEKLVHFTSTRCENFNSKPSNNDKYINKFLFTSDWRTIRERLREILPRNETKLKCVWEYKSSLTPVWDNHPSLMKRGVTRLVWRSEVLLTCHHWLVQPWQTFWSVQCVSTPWSRWGLIKYFLNIICVQVRIYQCRNGHNVCERCSSNPALVTCPQCREPYR